MLTRRSLIAAAVFSSLSATMHAHAQESAPAMAPVPAPEPEIIRLWPAGVPGGGGPADELNESRYGALSNISSPFLKVFRPANPNGAAVLVAAGGGYNAISMGGEAEPAAHWLTARGYTVFALAYRLPGEAWNCGSICSFQDAQRAMRVIRSRARQFRIDPAKIGALGFSAGGHLMGLASAWSSHRSYEPVDAIDEFSARPDWAALIYPVVTLFPPYDKTGTRRHMAPERATDAELAFWSVDTHVAADCPPILLVHADDDPVALVQHSEMMKVACEKAGVSVDFLRLPAGGHGFGMSKPGSPSFGWTAKLDDWLNKRTKDNMLPAVAVATAGRKS